MKRKAKAIWKGTGLEGTGTLTTPSGVFNNQPYSFKTRFESEDGTAGTNPEELMCSAHAGCFAMALSFQIVGAGFEAEELDVDCVLDFEKGDDGWDITHIKLILNAKIPGISEDTFMELAENAKTGCPISKALKTVPLEMEAHLG